MTARVSLGGVPLPGIDTIRWPFQAGVAPATTHIAMTRSMARAVFAKATEGPLTLELGDTTIRKVFVLGPSPGSTHPDVAVITIADLRWAWQQRWVVRRYNMRRRTGERRWLRGAVIDASAIADDLGFARYSLNEGKPWEPREALQDFMDHLRERTSDIVEWEAEPPPEARTIPIDNTVADDRGDMALARMLSHFNGVLPWVDEEGNVKWVNRYDQSEAEVIDDARPFEAGGLLPELLDARFRLPKEGVRVYFTRENEVRHNFKEAKTAASGHSNRRTLEADDSVRELENVIAQPLENLTSRGQTLPHGTLMRMDDFLVAVENTIPKIFPSAQPFNHKAIHEGWYRGQLRMLYANPLGSVQPDIEWERILGAVYQSYRQTYRFSAFWRQRTLTWSPRRVSIIDPETGEMGRSVVFSDYAYRPAFNRIVRNPTEAEQMRKWNVRGYARNLRDAKAAPADIQVVDQDLGVFHVNYKLKPWQDGELIPSAVVSDSTPGLDVAGSPALNGQQVDLEPEHQIAVVLTHIPAAPNDVRQFYYVDVSLEDIAEAYGVEFGKAEGPRLEVRVDPGVVTARFGWPDDNALQDIVESSFSDTPPDMEKLEPLLVDAEALEKVALAAAASEVQKFVPRWQGQANLPYNASMRPTGNLTDVSLEVTTQGIPRTVGMLSPIPDPPPMRSLLPQGVRQLLLREIQA